MGRRTSLASLAGAKVDDVPGSSEPLLLSLPLEKLAPTRFNPRRRFGTEEELREFGHKLAKEQLQPAVVVSRSAYLNLWPDEAECVGTASYVIANGERRFRASQLAGRPALEVIVREDVAASRAAFLDAVQSENNDRQDLDPIERAIAIETMVTELGGADQVAVYYGKTKGWVSQQRKLLKLTPELQDLVSSGEMPVRVGRDIASLPSEAQSVAWDEELAKRQAAKDAADRWKTNGGPPRQTRRKPDPAPRFTAVNQPPVQRTQADANGTGQPERFTAVNQNDDTDTQRQDVESPPDPVPNVDEESAEPAPEQPQLKRFPYDDGRSAAYFLINKMPADEFSTMLKLLVEHQEQAVPQA